MSEITSPPEIPNLERRVILQADADLRVEDRGGDFAPMVVGYAAVYNRLSRDLGGWKEKLLPGCFDRALTRSDVRALINHDPNLIMGRTISNTLRLSSDSHGLRSEIDFPNTALARHYLEAIRRQDISGMSFAFTVSDPGASFERVGDQHIRSVSEIDELFDICPVTYPAYDDTRVAVRSLGNYLASRPAEIDEIKELRLAPHVQRLALSWRM